MDNGTLVVLLDNWEIDSAGYYLPRGVKIQPRNLMTASEVQERLIELGDIRIDLERHQVTVRNKEVHLTPKEFDLLVYFAHNADRVLTHKTLLRAVWGNAGVNQPHYLRILVAQLRKKIEQRGEPRYILSEPWIGYRLSPQPRSFSKRYSAGIGI
jgi:two-component system KDP operon response regulator KdpE